MAPLHGAALIPLLTVLGTTAAAKVAAAADAQKYVPPYFAKKHQKRRARDDANHSDPDDDKTMVTKTVALPPMPTAQPQKRETIQTAPAPRSSEVAAVLLQDPYLLISALGVCIMVVAVLVSLMLVEFRDDVASLNDLQMFGPLMLVAMGFISLGMVLSMVNPKASAVVDDDDDEEKEKTVVDEKTISTEDAAMLKKAAQEGDQGFLYNYYKNKYANEPTTVEVDGDDGQPKKRVSRCPFGFT